MTAMMMLALSLAAPDDPSKPTPLEGAWIVQSIESRGTPIPLNRLGSVERYNLVVSGDRYALSTHAGTITVETTKGTVDFAVTDGRYKASAVLGSYELAGDTLKLAVSTPQPVGRARPAVDAPTRDGGHTLYTFKQDAAATPEKTAARLKERTGAINTPAGPGRGAPAPGPTTQDLLRQVIERLDRIEKRLDAMEKAKQ